MSAIILIILGAGILAVGYLRGWFDRADETLALLTDVKGTVNLEREGVLFPVTVQFNEGETVLDVLQRVCDAAGIHLEFSWTPMYNSYYIEGINPLFNTQGETLLFFLFGRPYTLEALWYGADLSAIFMAIG